MSAENDERIILPAAEPGDHIAKGSTAVSKEIAFDGETVVRKLAFDKTFDR